jgi:uncharacterized membrane protein YcjF (UPF0283 family)
MSLHPENKLKAPALIEVEGEADPGAQPFDDIAQGVAMEGVRRLVTRRSSGFARFAAWVFGSLFSLILTVAAWNFVVGLFAANAWLGWRQGSSWCWWRVKCGLLRGWRGSTASGQRRSMRRRWAI